MNLGKSVVGAACFAVLVLVTRGSIWPTRLPGIAFLWLALSGIVGLAFCDTLLLRAMMEIGPRRAQVVMCLNPVLVFLVVLLPPWSQTAAVARPWPWMGLALALGGVWMASRDAPDEPAHDPSLRPGSSRRGWWTTLRPARARKPRPAGSVAAHPASNFRGGVRAARRRGVVDAILAAFCNAAGVLLARLAIEDGADAIESSYVRLAVATAALLAGAFALRQTRAWTSGLTNKRVRLPLAAAAFVGTFLGIGCSQAGIEWASSTGVATVINGLAPVWLIPLSSMFLGERHTRRGWFSTLLAVAGVALLAI